MCNVTVTFIKTACDILSKPFPYMKYIKSTAAVNLLYGIIYQVMDYGKWITRLLCLNRLSGLL